MNTIEFNYREYSVKATYTRSIGQYLEDISFDVFNSQGEDITMDIDSSIFIDIHQEAVCLIKDIQ